MNELNDQIEDMGINDDWAASVETEFALSFSNFPPESSAADVSVFFTQNPKTHTLKEETIKNIKIEGPGRGSLFVTNEISFVVALKANGQKFRKKIIKIKSLEDNDATKRIISRVVIPNLNEGEPFIDMNAAKETNVTEEFGNTLEEEPAEPKLNDQYNKGRNRQNRQKTQNFDHRRNNTRQKVENWKPSGQRENMSRSHRYNEGRNQHNFNRQRSEIPRNNSGHRRGGHYGNQNRQKGPIVSMADKLYQQKQAELVNRSNLDKKQSQSNLTKMFEGKKQTRNSDIFGLGKPREDTNLGEKFSEKSKTQNGSKDKDNMKMLQKGFEKKKAVDKQSSKKAKNNRNKFDNLETY